MRDQRWQVVGFGLALALMSSTAVWLWPSVRDSLQNFDIPAAIKAFLGTDLDFATGAGYLSGRYFGWTEILAIVFAVLAGTGAVAGEESAGTIDLLLAQPVSRRSVVVQKLAASVLGTALIIAGGYLGFLVAVPTVDMEVGLVDLAVASANMLPIVLFFYALSLWAGAVAPNRGVAAGFVIGVTTATYFLFTIANGVDSLQPIRYATPFYYYGAGRSLVYGIEWWHVGVLLGSAAALVGLTLRTFERRDVSAGGATDLAASSVVRRIIGVRTGV
jgi:ABC-2 type transport system permease protein